MTLSIFRMIDDMQQASQAWQSAGLRVGLVPTMGALHVGHLSLIEALAPYSDKIIVSIFVNPTQFVAGEDLGDYPRQEAQDLSVLASNAVDAVFIPSNDEMYPQGFATPITPQGVALGLEAAQRPHFFGGVATIVAKLLLQTKANAAVFGEKDYQQLLVIKQLVRDLNIPTQIIAAPIMREKDGLAMSSRNVYLNKDERKIAVQLNIILKALATSTLSPDEASALAHTQLLGAGFTAIDYATLRDAQTLQPITQASPSRRALIAARINNIRLLDNMPCP